MISVSRFIVLSALAFACGGTVTSNDSPGTVGDEQPLTATVEAFSGRPNPTWTLTIEEVKEVRLRTKDLTATTEPEDFPKLGEAAYTIENNGKVPSLPDRIVAGRNKVGLTSKSKTSWFVDDKQLGSMLTQSARAAGALPQ